MFNFKPIKPGTFNASAMLNKVRALLEEEGREDRKLMEMTTQNWNDPPHFETKVTLAQDGIADTRPEGSDFQKKKWYWLERGTSVRYRKVSDDWQSKTSVGQLQSRSGKGKIIGKGRFPGIIARGWIPIIVRMRRKPFAARAQRVLGNVQATVRPSK